jgi:hypothetical protein
VSAARAQFAHSGTLSGSELRAGPLSIVLATGVPARTVSRILKRTSLLKFMHPRMISRGATTKSRWRSAPTCCATPISEEMVMIDEMLMVSAAHLDLAGAGR